MLVLTRKTGQRLWIGDQIAVTILQISPTNVRVGIEAPGEVSIVREELRELKGVRQFKRRPTPRRARPQRPVARPVRARRYA